MISFIHQDKIDKTKITLLFTLSQILFLEFFIQITKL